MWPPTISNQKCSSNQVCGFFKFQSENYCDHYEFGLCNESQHDKRNNQMSSLMTACLSQSTLTYWISTDGWKSEKKVCNADYFSTSKSEVFQSLSTWTWKLFVNCWTVIWTSDSEASQSLEESFNEIPSLLNDSIGSLIGSWIRFWLSWFKIMILLLHLRAFSIFLNF